MQIKTTLKYHLTPIRMDIVKKIREDKCWRGCDKKKILGNCWWDRKLVQLLWITVWKFLKKLTVGPRYEPAVSLLRLSEGNERKWKQNIKKISVLSSLVQDDKGKIWKQPSSVGERTKKMWSIHTMEYYSNIRRTSCHLQQHDGPWGHYAKWEESNRERQRAVWSHLRAESEKANHKNKD